MKTRYIQPETLAFHPKNIQQGTSARLRLPSVSAVRVSALSCPCVPHPTAGSPFSWIAPCALHDSRTATCPTTAVPTCSRAAPASSRHRGRRTASPFPGHGTKSLPASRRRGPAIRTGAKVLRGEGARGRGTLFQKRPPPPENTRPPPSKTMLQLPRPPPRRHLPKRARPGARQPRRGQASATVRAGGP